MRMARPGATHNSPMSWPPLAILLVCIFLVQGNQALVVQDPSYTRQSATQRPHNGCPLFSASNELEQESSIKPHNKPQAESMARRKWLNILSATASMVLFQPGASMAADGLSDDDPFVQRGNGFAYKFVPPAEMEPGAKPVKTHLFEINWKSPNTPRYTFGVTVDPVRIQNLKEFGTPEEVAAKVVLAEVNRDGIFEVTLVKDPVAVEEDGILSYVLNYLSQGKRGDKRFVAKFCIQNQRLYALTAQVLETDYNTKEAEILKAVESFRVLP